MNGEAKDDRRMSAACENLYTFLRARKTLFVLGFLDFRANMVALSPFQNTIQKSLWGHSRVLCRSRTTIPISRNVSSTILMSDVPQERFSLLS